jgi:hypothetical protein
VDGLRESEVFNMMIHSRSSPAACKKARYAPFPADALSVVQAGWFWAPDVAMVEKSR